MEMSPSRETASCAATQVFPNILWNPKIHYRVHKSPRLVPILSQIDSVHTTPFNSSNIHFNIIHPSPSWTTFQSLPFWLSYQYPTRIPPLSHSCYMPCPFHPPWLDQFNFTWRRVQVKKHLITQFSWTSSRFISPRSKYSPQDPVLS
jgi:hypothetical protein